MSGYSPRGIGANHIPGINFQGYLLRNPATDFKVDGNSKVQFAHYMALIPDELYQSVKKTCKRQYVGTNKNDMPCAMDLEALGGDHDMMVSYIGTQAWIKSLNFPIIGQWRPWLQSR
ncbi:Peptidase S10, serine carboxypeptidase [Trema orientale]|uniref:Peptidase S10, serine carboxypeptidase n=1 Tax=Trema orientale TaxID=63057 RepID=A0A2P5FSA8_TREOI|nr:Peptidase S10, serine carboxypeptidase [Trema orientale]